MAFTKCFRMLSLKVFYLFQAGAWGQTSLGHCWFTLTNFLEAAATLPCSETTSENQGSFEIVTHISCINQQVSAGEYDFIQKHKSVSWACTCSKLLQKSYSATRNVSLASSWCPLPCPAYLQMVFSASAPFRRLFSSKSQYVFPSPALLCSFLLSFA